MVKHAIEKPEDRSNSKYKGVRKRKWGKWVSEVRLPNSRERIWLGSYDSAEKAARAFDAALFCLRGRSAKFNFPDNPPDIAGGRTLSPPEIQAAAARFAHSIPDRNQADHLSTEQSGLQVESPCPSVVSEGSQGTVQLELESSELSLEGSFLDMFTNMGSCNYPADYGIFPGFDDLHDNFFVPPPMEPTTIDFGEDINMDGISAQGSSFLWNF